MVFLLRLFCLLCKLTRNNLYDSSQLEYASFHKLLELSFVFTSSLLSNIGLSCFLQYQSKVGRYLKSFSISTENACIYVISVSQPFNVHNCTGIRTLTYSSAPQHLKNRLGFAISSAILILYTQN